MKKKLTAGIILMGCSLLTLSAAGTLTWDNGSSTGNWNTTDLNWTGAAAWNNTPPNDAVFDATGVGPVTLTEAITAGTITFGAAGYTIDTATFGLTLDTGITTNESTTILSGTGGSMILGGNNDWFVGLGSTLTVSSSISGTSFGITKSGAGTLALSGTNTYTGDTTLSGGTVVISNPASFGAGDVLVTGTSRINATGSLSYPNGIDVGATLSLQNTTTTANIATYTGALTGSGNILLINSGAGNIQIEHFFSDTNNTFTGNVIGPTGNLVGADYFRFASIGDGGTFSYNRSGNRGGVIYDGTSAIEFDTRQIVLGTALNTGSNTIGNYAATLSGLNGNGIPVNSFANNASNSADTVTFNTDMAMTSITNNSFFYFDGSNAGDNTFAGDIGDPEGQQKLGIGKWGTGRWILTGNNSFEGDLVVANGTLSVPTIDNIATNQPIGRGSLIILGHANTSGTLEYTGSANAETDKQIVLGNLRNNNQTGQGSIVNNGTGTLTFTNAAFNSVENSTTTRARAVTLGGTNTGANTISGTIQRNLSTGTVGLIKNGTGTWVLAGENTYNGPTTISAGTLIINGDQSAATGAVAVNGTSTLGGSGTIGGSVTVASGAMVASGGPGETLTINGNLNISAMAGGTGTLNFQLNSAAAGDWITVVGTLTIGGDALGFNDFVFSNHEGLQKGVYKLISSGAPVSGTLDAANLAGAIGDLECELRITGNDLELVVGSGVGGDYDDWAANFPDADLSAPDADFDGDGLSNDQERIFGLNPTSGTSVNPISVPLDPAAGTFSFTRRDPALSGLVYSVWTSTDLVAWTEDEGAALTPGAVVDEVQTVAVQLSAELLAEPKLFLRLAAVMPEPPPPPPPLLEAAFEDNDGGFTVSTAGGTIWTWGAPNSPDQNGGAVTAGAGGSAKCWGTNLTGGYIDDVVITP